MDTTHNEEKAKYEKCWNTDGYRIHSPGENSREAFMQIVKPQPGSSIIDFGSGTARASLEFAKEGFQVTMLDLTEQSMDQEVRDALASSKYNLSFTEVNLWKAEDIAPFSAQYGYCCDVMEHIPTEYVMSVLKNIMGACPRVFFYICLLPDSFGQIIGKPLHLTVRPFTWWRDKLAELGTVVDARDLLSNGMYYVEAPHVKRPH